MTWFQVGILDDYAGEAIVLAGEDPAGLRMCREALQAAHEQGEGSFDSVGGHPPSAASTGAADIELGPPRVDRRFHDLSVGEDPPDWIDF